MDSGQEKRYSRFKSINNDEFQEIVKAAIGSRRGQYFDNNEYKNYKDFSSEILSTTNNKKEMGILFNDNGDVIIKRLGTKNALKFEENEYDLLKNNKFIHNHPSGYGLSKNDVAVAVGLGLKEIVATTNQNIMYRLVLKSKLDYKKTMIEYEQAKLKVSSIFYDIVKDGLITKEQVKKEFDHFVLSLFAKSTEGVKYESKRY